MSLGGFSSGNFGAGAFDLGAFSKGFLPGGNSAGLVEPAVPFQTGVDAGGGFANPSSGIAGKFNGLFNNINGLFNNDLLNSSTVGSLSVANTLGGYGIQAANNYREAAKEAALNNQTNLDDDFRDQYNAAKLKQNLAINPEQRQKNLMGVIPQFANSITSTTGSPTSGIQSAARLTRLLA